MKLAARAISNLRWVGGPEVDSEKGDKKESALKQFTGAERCQVRLVDVDKNQVGPLTRLE
jgi:hypothetical protein